jgi:antitoxin (DNA-binding transcriptional repressor) of toxin-antitoxin stability system
MTQVFNVHAAKSQLSKLIELVESGEKVEIARAGKVVVELVRARPRSRLPLDEFPNSVAYVAPDFDAPLPGGSWGEYELQKNV